MKRFVFGAGFAALFFSFSTLFVATPAHAGDTVKVIPTDCSYVQDGQEFLLPEASSNVTTTAPAEVETAQGFDVSVDVLTTPVNLGVDIQTDNITIDFQVLGGATPTTFQGKTTTSLAHPGDDFHFGPYHAHLTAPASPGTVTIKIKDVHIGTLSLGPSVIKDATCAGPDDTFDLTIATVGVVPTAPPGAPNAKADSATTKAGTPVTVDVLATDTASDVGPIDVSSLAIAAQGTKGNAEIVDGKLVYTPKAGATGTDTVRYQVCTDQTQVQQPGARRNAAEPLCDEAVVTITIASSTVGGQGGGTTPSTAGATTTTAAKELPRTGRSSAPGAAIGFGLVSLGTAALFLTRRQRTAAN